MVAVGAPAAILVSLLISGYLAEAFQGSERVSPCSSEYFADIIPEGAVVESVQNVASGIYVERGNLGYPTAAAGLPPLCAVIIRNSTANYRFGMFLPDTWNSKLLVVGNGAFLGGINWLDMGPGPKFGMASLSTDTGHNSGSGDQTWADTDEKKTNWAYRALEGSTVLGKILIRAYYDETPIAYTYYSGCSTGGRQGLKQIQRDPNIFDGALIGAPAWDTKHLMPWISKLAVWNLPEDGPHAINNASLFQRLQAEVVAQCDDLDDVHDNIVSAPDLCQEHFNITKLRCDVTSNHTACWTQAQIETAQKMYSDYVIESVEGPGGNGVLVYKGLTHSSEAEWTTYLLPIAEDEAGNVRRNFDAQYERYFMNYGADWPITAYNDSVADDSRRLDSHGRDSATADQYADLEAFRRRGGKVILYGGLADGLVPVRHTTLYYERTAERITGSIEGDITDFFRYFQIPGMGHCRGSRDNVKAPWMIGGASQAALLPPYNAGFSVPLGFNDSRHDALLALMEWVERGNAPSEIIASEFNFTNPERQSITLYRQRPICVYPRKAVWDRTGAQDDASSWSCR